MHQRVHNPKNRNVTKGAMDEGLRRALKHVDQEAKTALNQMLALSVPCISLNKPLEHVLGVVNIAYDLAIFIQQSRYAEKRYP